MTIRPEASGDVRAIENIHIAAFAVNALRAAGALTISLAEMDGEIVGHIAFSPVRIDGRDCAWYILGPIGVRPDLQRKGIGRALMSEGLEALRKLRAEGCGLVGDPAYYTRFGFACRRKTSCACRSQERSRTVPWHRHSCLCWG